MKHPPSPAPRRFGCSILGLLALLAVGAPAARSAASELHVFHHENVLGTSFELKVAAAGESDAARVEQATLAEIRRLAGILGTYDPDSEAAAWLRTRTTPVVVSAELFEVLGHFDTWRTRTAGALDAAAGVACQLWTDAAARQRVPDAVEMNAAVETIRQPHWSLDPVRRTATRLSAAPLVFNSFVKGYILGRAADAALVATQPAPAAVIVNLGGDLVVRGDRTETVAIADPRSDAENDEPLTRLRVRNRAVATSGGYRRGVTIAGRWYSHLVDPRTARPVDHILSATVVGPEPVTAGALATASCVLAPEESLRLVAEQPGFECLLLTRDGRHLTSRRWNELEVPRVQLAAAGEARGLFAATTPAPASATAAPAPVRPGAVTDAVSTWDPAFDLQVNFELSRIDDRGYRRPFVAIWVEDKEKFPVRTLALWFDRPRWLPDLRAWYRADQLRALAEGTDITTSVSSATRPAGRYSVRWDGKDDRGRFVPAGRYTVFLEAAREHGTYQLMRQELEFRGNPVRAELKGNPEIASASLEYRRRPATR